MKDVNDTQTADIFPMPRRRGRPVSGQAMTPAERAKRYRDNKRANPTPSQKIDLAEVEALRARVAELEALRDWMELQQVKDRAEFLKVIKQKDAQIKAAKTRAANVR